MNARVVREPRCVPGQPRRWNPTPEEWLAFLSLLLAACVELGLEVGR